MEFSDKNSQKNNLKALATPSQSFMVKKPINCLLVQQVKINRQSMLKNNWIGLWEMESDQKFQLQLQLLVFLGVWVQLRLLQNLQLPTTLTPTLQLWAEHFAHCNGSQG